MTYISNIILPKDDVIKAIEHAKLIAKRNRCRSWNKNISVISGDMNVLRDNAPMRLKPASDNALGVCWQTSHETRVIFLKPNREEYETVITLCHELAHAFTNPNASHSYSWRSLNLLYFVTLPRIFGYQIDSGSMFDEIRYIRDRYEPRGHTPINRHLDAMDRMLAWYVKTVEKDSAS